jgi:hypothetical protein
MSQISIPENFGSEIVDQIKSKYTSKKSVAQKSVSYTNLLMKSSTRLLSKKSILESIDESEIREQSLSHSNTKSTGTFKIRSNSVTLINLGPSNKVIVFSG